MRSSRSFCSRSYEGIAAMSLAKDLWDFTKERKKWWLAPVIIMLALLGLLIAAGGTAIAPFIYTIF